MKLAHKIALDPTPQQRQFFARAAGVSRFVYNWALEHWNSQYQAGEKPNGLALKKHFNGLKHEQFPWVEEVHRDAAARPFTDLHRAFVNWWQGRAERPVFKKKKHGQGSFYVANDKFRVEGKTVCLPKVGRVKMREALRFQGAISGATVGQEADRWFIAIQVDVPFYQRPRTADGVVGVDLGITVLATLSTGEQIVGPKALTKNLKKLRRLSRSLSRKQKGSQNRIKAKRKLARCHQRIANLRKDVAHKLTTRLCRENQTVVVEDLSVQGMVQNPHLSRAISDAGWGEIRRQLTYKTPLFGTQLVVADRFFPSSKRCTACGYVLPSLPLDVREWTCPQCGAVHDREGNAAVNLEQLGWATAEAQTPADIPALASPSGEVKLEWVKQELTRVHVYARER